MPNRTFKTVSSIKPSRSVFDLSHERQFTCDMGQLIPCLIEEVMPGDHFKIGNEIVARMQPLVSPVLHEINITVHYYFIPFRLLWDEWEDFITGGADGLNASTIPRWDPTTNTALSLWDYMGLPVGIDPDGCRPYAFILYAYNAIYNAYYRDETQIAEVALTNEAIKIRAWEKDYFTSALPWQQRGTAPSLPISGTTHALWDAADDFVQMAPQYTVGFSSTAADPHAQLNHATAIANMHAMLEANDIDLSGATTFDVSDLRLAFQLQKFLERNARTGSRYTEFLKSMFDVAPNDERLQRPEYIGGSKTPVIISEVLQTSESNTTPQGNLAGHGISVDQQFCASYAVKEFGLIMGIFSIMPKPMYTQGVDRQWLRETKYDFPFPLFANLSEQAILTGELYATNVAAENETIFGYQGRYDEMRVRRNVACGGMQSTFDYWNISRQFAAAPSLNQAFIECVPRKDIFAVQDEPGFIINIGHSIIAIRPLPEIAEPGKIDH